MIEAPEGLPLFKNIESPHKRAFNVFRILM